MESLAPLFERLGGRPALLRLLTHFYADVRQHRLLGPVFERHITNWPAHIEKIADFWTQVTGGPAAYGGGMAARHIPLGLREEQFQSWLGLFEANCRLWLAADCAGELSAMARQIGQRLRQFCGLPQPSALSLDSVQFRNP
jgi:hemoglobin